MTKEKLEKAIKDYVEAREVEPYDEYSFGLRVGARDGFQAGALWRISSAWHEPTEEPRHFELCLIEIKGNTFRLAYSGKFEGEQPYFEACFESDTYDMDEVIRYAYIKDLIPTEE